MFLIRKLHYLGVLLGVALLPVSCLDTNGSKSPENSTPEALHLPPMSDTIFAGGRDTTVLLRNGKAVIMGHFDAHKEQVNYLVPTWNNQTMTAIIVPGEHDANMRFNQVIMPGGVSEGPFKDTLVYKLKANGNLRLVIGHDPKKKARYTGDFMLQINLKEDLPN